MQDKHFVFDFYAPFTHNSRCYKRCQIHFFKIPAPITHTDTFPNTNSVWTHTLQPSALGLDPVRTIVELLPLLLLDGNCLWALNHSLGSVCVCLHVPASVHTPPPPPPPLHAHHITQWVYFAASCHKYVCDLTFHSLTPVPLGNNSSGICKRLFVVADCYSACLPSCLPVPL